MREIKFRAWNGDEMFANPDIVMNENIPLNQQISALQGVGVLMQYTGLKDKNGKEIYEGDILSTSGKLTEKFPIEIVWDQANAWYTGRRHNGHEASIWPDSREVIGNIYENPELLASGEATA